MSEEILEFAYKFIFDFQYMNLKTGKYNKIEFEYLTPSVNGLSKFHWGKNLDSVKPSTLEYIIYNLQNADLKMINDAIIAYLYYWKIRKTNSKKMREVYKNIKYHYTKTNKENIPIANIQYKAIVYSITFYIGSIKINKFGFTEDKYRYQKMISDVRNKYQLVSIGNFTINQEIQFKSSQNALEFEAEALKNLKEHSQYLKGKNCFDGYKESYL